MYEKTNNPVQKSSFLVMLSGLELIIMGILSKIHYTLITTDKTCTDVNGLIIGCPQDERAMIGLLILLVVIIVNIVLGIRLLINKRSHLLVIISFIITLLPLLAWFYTYNNLKEFSQSYETWDKPVLYLYPEKEETVIITFKHPENLLTTYPKYKRSWKINANPDGGLYDENNKYYYALYWDEKNTTEEKFDEGFYVTKENTITVLEKTLTQIGLTRREQNEFIMYWLPILEKNKKSIINYKLTEKRQEENKLMINPKPDSLLRIAINIKKVDKKVNIKPQQLPHFTREDFTTVEWGGTV